MILGSINHIGLTVSDMARAAGFYEALLGHLGYARVEETAEYILWAGPGGGLGISPVRPELAERRHDRYAVGLHHLAFHAPSRADVDAAFAKLQAMGAEVTDAPAEYDYLPGYYAVYFLDPDGIKLEVAHTPGFPA
jgi:catechol 2,3-dioxygenase-like lactoylglutathione lyase family enzyme